MAATLISARGLGKEYSFETAVMAGATFRDRIAEIIRTGGCALRRPESQKFWALRDVTFDVSGGEVLGIIGRNGAGKSTLMKILSQITPPTEGEAGLYGHVASLRMRIMFTPPLRRSTTSSGCRRDTAHGTSRNTHHRIHRRRLPPCSRRKDSAGV